MRRLLCIVVMAVAVLPLRAQYDPSFTNYWNLQSYYNPSASGAQGMLDIRAVYNMQMVGFEGGGRTMLIMGDMPLFFLNNNHGGGVGFMNDKIGLFSHKKVFLQYAYHQKIRKTGKLSVGVRFGMLNETFGGEMDMAQSGDPAFPSGEANGMGIDLDFGLRYQYRDIWDIGIAGMHLLAPTIKLGSGEQKRNEIKVERNFFVNGGYRVKFNNPVYSLRTNAMFQTDMQTWRADMTARLCYDGDRGKLYGGINYSPTISVGILLGMDFHGVSLGYSYEMFTAIGAINGSHELNIGYKMDLTDRKKGKNLHKSVRFL